MAMSMLGTVRDLLEASTQDPNRGDGDEVSKGAFWCDDCGVRIRDVEVEGEGTPDCPECDEAMRFERSAAATGCAC